MDDHDQHHRRFEISPLFIGLLGIIAGAIMVATYQCIAIGFCTQRRVNGARNIIIQSPDQQDRRPDNTNNSTTRAQLKSTIRFSKEFKEETCAVCLSEFLEGEEIRVLPECMHSFHAPCVDMWLSSHPNCPLCRAGAEPPQHVVVSVSDSGGDTSSVVQGLPNFERLS